MHDEHDERHLKVPEVCERLNISRSTCQRYLGASKFPGARKRHTCDGTICGTPYACRHGEWEIPEQDVAAIFQPDGVR